jgi:glutamate dehydrogenase (NADP+)
MIAKACPEYSLSKPSTLVAISGSGNVAQFTALKVIELGGTVLSLSDSKGSLIATDGGFTKDVIESVGTLKLKGGSLESFTSFASDQKYKYYPGTGGSSS